jgi:hypothetical protein
MTFVQRTTSPSAAPTASTVIGAASTAFSSGISKNQAVSRTSPATTPEASAIRMAAA